jgi:hypothetical protein
MPERSRRKIKTRWAPAMTNEGAGVVSLDDEARAAIRQGA